MPTELFFQTRTSQIYGGTISLIVLAILAVALRLYARSITRAKLWWDDWILVLALFFDCGLSTCYWLQVMYSGLGSHTAVVGGPVTEEQVFIFFKIFLPLELFYFSSAFAIKTSLILLYYRIFAIVSWFRRLLILAWLIVFLYFIVDFFVAIFECKPVSFFWDNSIEGGRCINQNQFYRWNGVANLLIDFMLLTLPMPMIWNMTLPSRQKLTLSGLFLLGTFACAASIIRVIAFNQVDFNDITYTMVDVSIWSTIEQSIGIICACLITYRPLLGRIRSAYGETFEKTATQNHTSKSAELPNLRSTTSQRFSDVSAAGFARLYEEDDLEHGIKTHITATRMHGFPIVPQVIMKNQIIEQCHEHVSEGSNEVKNNERGGNQR